MKPRFSLATIALVFAFNVLICLSGAYLFVWLGLLATGAPVHGPLHVSLACLVTVPIYGAFYYALRSWAAKGR